MKTIVLAGGFGMRLSEKTVVCPIPLVEIGGQPMLWRIMNIYSAFGVKEFLVACGYEAEFIKEYFQGCLPPQARSDRPLASARVNRENKPPNCGPARVLANRKT